MKLHRHTQGSAEWYAARLGKPTASQFHRIVTPTGKPSTQARNYMYKLIFETLLRESTDDQLGNLQWVQRGTEMEPKAAAQYAFETDTELEDGGFVTDNNERMGASPDRLIKGKNEALEIKCPAGWTQIGYLIDGPGNDYRPQVQGQLLIGEFDAVHFYAYHPQCPSVHLVSRPDAAYQRIMRQLLRDFLEQLDSGLDKARRLGTFIPTGLLPLEKYAGEDDEGPEPIEQWLKGSE
jgi:hypothetical protein